MVLRLTPIAPVLLGVTLAQVALGLMATLIPLLLLRSGVATPVIGLVASAYFAGFLAGALSAARIVASVGHIRAFTVFAACAAITAQMLVFEDGPWVVGATRLVMGYASSGLFLVAESWIHERADGTTRGRFFGAYQAVNWGASALGPLLLGVVRPQANLFAFVGAAFAAALLPMALTHQPNPSILQNRRLSLRRLFAISPVGVVCCLASGLLNAGFYAMMPVFLDRNGFDAAAISSFASAVLVAALVVQYPLGLLADVVERRKLTLLVLAVSLAGAVGILLLAGHSLALLIVFGCMMSCGMSPLYGLGAGQTNDRLERGDTVGAAGGLLFCWSMGAAIGPTLAGSLMGPLGPVGLFLYLVVSLLLLAGFVVLRMLRRGEVPLEEQSPLPPGSTAPPRLPALAPAPRMKS